MKRLQRFYFMKSLLLILSPIIFSLFLFSFYIFFIHFPQNYNSLLERKKAALTDITQVVYSVLEFYHAQEENGTMSHETAQQFALQYIMQLRYGADLKNYFWVNDFHPSMILHPYVPELNGQDLRSYQDRHGKHLFVEMVDETAATGSGFVSYSWQWQDDDTRIVPKLSYVKRFNPWQWIIGTGVYLNDVHEEANRQARQLFITSFAILAAVIVLTSISIWHLAKVNQIVRQSESALRAIFEQTKDIMGILQLDGVTQKLNDAGVQFMEAREDELIGQIFWQSGWWAEQPATREKIHQAVTAAQQGEMTLFELSHGEEGRRKVFDFSILPITDQDGTVLFVLVNGRDITERIKDQEKLNELNLSLEDRVAARTKELEESLNTLKQTRDKLVQSEKMAALGSLVAGVSHEINTPLGLGVTNASFLQEELEKMKTSYKAGKFTKGEFEQFLAKAEDATKSMLLNLNRGAEIIRSFKQVAVDQEVEEIRQINLHDYMEEVLLSLKPRFKHSGHTITTQIPEEISLKTCPGFLMQVFSNLIINSHLHAFENKQAGRVRIEAQQLGDTIQIVYTDDGQGMTAEQAKRIYDPFFTTKQGDGGTGLGMHIVFNLIHQKLGGKIDLETAPGKGVKFTLLIPRDLPKNIASNR